MVVLSKRLCGCCLSVGVRISGSRRVFRSCYVRLWVEYCFSFLFLCRGVVSEGGTDPRLSPWVDSLRVSELRKDDFRVLGLRGWCHPFLYEIDLGRAKETRPE